MISFSQIITIRRSDSDPLNRWRLWPSKLLSLNWICIKYFIYQSLSDGIVTLRKEKKSDYGSFYDSVYEDLDKFEDFWKSAQWRKFRFIVLKINRNKISTSFELDFNCWSVFHVWGLKVFRKTFSLNFFRQPKIVFFLFFHWISTEWNTGNVSDRIPEIHLALWRECSITDMFYFDFKTNMITTVHF